MAKADKEKKAKDIIEELSEEPIICSELMDELPDSIIIHDTNHNIVYANRFAYESHGYTAAEIVALKIEDINAPSHKGKIPEIIKESKDQGSHVFEAVSIKKDGTEYPVEVWVKPIVYRGKQCVIGTARDLTSRKAMEQKAHEQSVKTRQYLNLVPVIVLALDRRGMITMINEYGAEILGCPEEMIVGKNWVDNFIPESDRKSVKLIFEKIASGNMEGIEHHENKIIAKDREIRTIAWKNSYIREASGQVVSVLSSGIDVTDLRYTQTQIERSYERLERVIDGIVGALSKTVETKDPYTAGHQARVALLAREIAKEIGLNDGDIRGIYIAATIHDIGKIYVPAEILNKPGALSDIEFGMIKLHPQTGFDVLKDIDFVDPVAAMVLQHHERMDGTGYPNGVAGNDISIGARILAVSDVVEAMSSHRPYRAGLGIAPALDEISTKSGKLYDKDAVAACLALFESKRFSFSD